MEIGMEGQWLWSKKHKEICKVIESETLWGQTYHKVWLPRAGMVLRLGSEDVAPLDEAGVFAQSSYLTYASSAARVADLMNQDVLLAPLEAAVIPLPHQIRALSVAMSKDRVRYLLADEVGLGKTIEAGLIMRELKLRGLVKRVLIVVPRGLVSQWISEMRLKFNEDFRLILPEDIDAVKRLFPDYSPFLDDSSQNQLAHLFKASGAGNRQRADNPFTMFDQVICPLDSFKPIEKRRGWSQDEVDEYNRTRYENLVNAGWDLVIVDEAHRLGGTTEHVARHKLGKGLSQAAPYLLLLSATPHQGKSDAFRRVMSLLDPNEFAGEEPLTPDTVHKYVIRTSKRNAIDLNGEPLFKPRETRLMPIEWESRHRLQKELYEEVSFYVREGYNQAIEEKRNYMGFLLLLMQRLVTSSTRAIKDTLEKRAAVLENPWALAGLPRESIMNEEWSDLDGQLQLDTLMSFRLETLKNEEREVKRLLALAQEAEISCPDAKAEALIRLIYDLRQEEMDPDLKFLIFTEFVSTQKMLQEFLLNMGFHVVCINGSMDMDARVRAQKEFASDAQFLVSTDAGGEGINLQFCHVVINYDIPWNPMKLEQRIGRVDRIGQDKTVKAINFVLRDTVEYRVQEVLEEKLYVILKEFGVDKTQDVLDSGEAGYMFENIYREMILHPDLEEYQLQQALEQVREEFESASHFASLLETTDSLDPSEAKRICDNPAQYWVEQMVTSYLRTYGGKVTRKLDSFDLIWPDGEVMKDIVFTAKDARANPTVQQLTMENPRVRAIASNLPRFVSGQPIPEIAIPDLPEGICGYWSLWRIGARGIDFDQYRMMPYFVTDSGQVFVSTAKFIWDNLMNEKYNEVGVIFGSEAERIFRIVEEGAMAAGKEIYDELVRLHSHKLKQEQEKMYHSFEVRRKDIERLGLDAVRAHRLKQLNNEIQEWKRQMDEKARVHPDFVPIVIARVR